MNRLHLRVLAALALALVAAAVVSCVTDKVTGKKKFSLVSWSTDQEIQMGTEMAPNIESQFDGVWADAGAHAYLEGLIQEMADHSVRKDDFSYTFQVLNSSIPNAFALPGGFVYITRGLLAELESEAQFISIMGHELGHVEHQHSMMRQSQTLAAGAVSGAIAVGGGLLAEDSDNPELVALATTGAATLPGLMVLKYSRDQELESDRRGVFFADAMGYDPREGQRTFELFQRLEQASGGGGAAWANLSIFRTHPLNQDRIQQIQDIVRQEYPAVAGNDAARFRTGVPRFPDLVAKLRRERDAYQQYDQATQLLASGDPTSVAQAESMLSGLHQAQPDEPLFAVALGEAQFVLKKRKQARTTFRTALDRYRRYDAEHSHWKPHYYLGYLALQSGQPGQALPDLQAATRRYPQHPEPHLQLARAFEKTGDAARARQEFERVTALTPVDSAAHRWAQGQVRRLAAASASP